MSESALLKYLRIYRPDGDIDKQVIAALERAERVETAARQVEAFGWGENGPAELQTAILDLRAALAPAPEGSQ